MTYKITWNKPELTNTLDDNGMPVGNPIDNWTTRPWPPKQTMNGACCRLEPFDLDNHSEGLFTAFSQNTDARNWTYLPYGPFNTIEEFRAWARAQCLNDNPLFHTIVNQANNEITGLASYLRIAPEIGSIEVGHIHFSPLMQGTRMATESMYLMMCRVFDELKYRRYEWKCDALNTPSCRAAERLGFQFEGIFRQATISKNRNRDTAWFAIIDADWPALKAGYEQWLAEDNFNSAGKQIRSLNECTSPAL